MKKRNNTTRYFAIFMLAMIAIIAIALIVIGFVNFHHIFIKNGFWFDLSGFSLTAQSGIRGIVGWLATFVPMITGIAIILKLVGDENIMKLLDKLMD